ncbi:MAG: hypothetical protein IJS99_00940 [Synergistaceae bacterium]|nr:hypothetical protein [Synergistaceae bacterium]
MNENILFRFKTRARQINGDYRVFSDGGQRIHPESEFSSIEDKSNRDDTPCAIMYCGNKKIYVAAFGLQRGVKDFANRPIMFSFCQIFTEWPSAWAAFTRLIYNWNDAGKFISSLITERGKDIIFEQEKFISWLQADKQGNYKFYTLNPDDLGIDLSEIDANFALIPKNNCVLKWEEGGQEIYCFRPVVKGYNGQNIRQGNKLFRKIMISAAILVIIILAGVGTKFYLDAREAEALQAVKNSVKSRVNNSREINNKLSQDIAAKTQELINTLENAKNFIGSSKENFDSCMDTAKKLNSAIINAKKNFIIGEGLIESADKKINAPDFDNMSLKQRNNAVNNASEYINQAENLNPEASIYTLKKLADELAESL